MYNDGANIGIGLSTPESPLQVRGSGNGNITSILVDAEIKLLMDKKNLDENLIAIEIDKNKRRVTIII